MNTLLLPLLVALPFVGSIGIYLTRGRLKQRQIYTMALTLLTTALTWLLILNRPEGSFVLLQFTSELSIAFKLDGFGCLFAGMVSILWPLATLYAFEYMAHASRRNTFYTFYIMTYGVTLGVALSANMLTMYIFYELLTLVTLPLVIHELGHDAMFAGRKYLRYSLGGSALAFLGLVYLITFADAGTFVLGGDLNAVMASEHRSALLVVYVLSFLGFGVKAAVFPVHGWLPTAGVAPTPVTALLHAVAVVKAGVFAITRLTYYCFGTEFLSGTWAQYTVLGLAIFTIFYGSSMAVKERHFKRRLAYSTVSNLSYILFGICLMNPVGMAAGLLHMLFHSVMKILGFLSAGSAIHRSGREYIFQLDGLGRKMPVTFLCLTIAGLGLTGVPLFAGFISKWQLAQAAVKTADAFSASAAASGAASFSWLPILGMAVLLISALLTAIYMMTIAIRAFVHPFDAAALPAGAGHGTHGGDVHESGWCILLPLCIFAVLVIVFGVYPQPLMELVTAIAQGTF